MPDSLGIDNDVVLLSTLAHLDDVVDQLLLIIIVGLRQKNILRAIRNPTPQRDITRVPAHDLDDRAALMRG